ncbi:MAG TPA: hypothetical protein VIL85_01920, partial [Thermomicrobiales bacterium]
MAEVSRTITPIQGGTEPAAGRSATPPRLFAYHAYGLTLHAQLPLPELRPATEQSVPDIVIHLGTPDAISPAWRGPGAHFDDPLREVALVYTEGGSFFIRGGREVIVVPMPGQDEAAIRLNLLGVALAVAQHQRGRLVLHGSVVAADGRAVAFLGGSGWGKSTLAASLHNAGYPLIADDLVSLEFVDGVALAHPAYPQQKLWPDTATALGTDPATLPPLVATATKRALRLGGPFPRAPLPLRRLYVLAEAATPALIPLAGPTALAECVRHSFCVGLLSRSGDAAHFRQCADLLRQVAVARLERPKEFATLPVVRRLIEADLAAIGEG